MIEHDSTAYEARLRTPSNCVTPNVHREGFELCLRSPVAALQTSRCPSRWPCPRAFVRQLAWLLLVSGAACGNAARDNGGSSGGFGSAVVSDGNTAGVSDSAASGDGASGASGDDASDDDASDDGASSPSDGDHTAGGSSDPSGSGAPGDGPGADTDPTTGPGAEAGTRFDLPPGGASVGDDGMVPEGACKIDFLFVIDDSCSMGNDVDSLNASLSGFVSTIQTRFADHNHHIMVVDTDHVQIDEYTPCRATCALGLVTTCEGLPCTGLPPDDPCLPQFGAGITNTPNIGVSCNFHGGNRYIIDSEPNLDDTFKCAARRGETGITNEKPMGSLLAAISPEMNAAGACNAGFLRRDAILVITIVTDEEDDPNDHAVRNTMDADMNSAGDPVSWKQQVVDIKNGDETAVVVLGILGDSDLAGATTQCPPLAEGVGESPGTEGAEAAHRLRQFSDSFPYGSWIGICESNYAPYFDQAVSVIDTACETFVPPPE